MKVSETGEIAIPPELQEKYGFTPGTEVTVTPEQGNLTVSKATPEISREEKKAAIDEWLRKASGVGRSGLSTDQVLQITRGEE
jgi:bifunctional DNA-binding transcriptional regulator/antitoxin component of YhaV-PrlF toxin-antitoxin module